MTPTLASGALLVLFAVTWLGAAWWTGRKTGSMPAREVAPLYIGGALACVALAAVTFAVPAMRERLWPPQPAFDWTMVTVCMAGFVFCWWARLHLGRLWSGGVIVREGHRVVDTGPYAVVRHPIYSGAFAGLIAFSAIRARPADIVFAVGIVTFFALKARIEERFLRRELGAAYDDYRTRVPMLVPGLRRGRDQSSRPR
jgi:protein-S-isoprenylcysteine O-methyltransferase Ste14